MLGVISSCQGRTLCYTGGSDGSEHLSAPFHLEDLPSTALDPKFRIGCDGLERLRK